MNEFNESIAHITCICGDVFQVINEAGNDWDAIATAAIYDDHLRECPGKPDPDPAA